MIPSPLRFSSLPLPRPDLSAVALGSSNSRSSSAPPVGTSPHGEPVPGAGEVLSDAPPPPSPGPDDTYVDTPSPAIANTTPASNEDRAIDAQSPVAVVSQSTSLGRVTPTICPVDDHLAVSTDDCPEDTAKMVKYLLGKGSWGSRWQGLVAAYLDIERHNGFKSEGRLPNPTHHRPSEIPKWMKYARPLADFDIEDVDRFTDQWWQWWRANQPSHRRDHRLTASNNVDEEWSQLAVTGPSGLVLFLVSSAWWGAAVGEASIEHQQSWLDAIEDMLFAFQSVLRHLQSDGGSSSSGTARVTK